MTFQESSIIEAVEKQLQGTSSASSQPSLTPQMGKKPQMGTHVTQQHQQQQQQQMDQQAITPLSGENNLKIREKFDNKTSNFRFIVKTQHVLVDGKVRICRSNAPNNKQARKTSASATKAHQVIISSSTNQKNLPKLFNSLSVSFRQVATQPTVTMTLATSRNLTVWVKLQNLLLAVASLSIFCFEVFLNPIMSSIVCVFTFFTTLPSANLLKPDDDAR